MNTYVLFILDLKTGKEYTREYKANNAQEAVSKFYASFSRSSYDVLKVKKK